MPWSGENFNEVEFVSPMTAEEKGVPNMSRENGKIKLKLYLDLLEGNV